MNTVEISSVSKDDCHELSVMVGELLSEIMDTINANVFSYDETATETRAKDLIEAGKFWAFIARDNKSGNTIGFVSLYESYALYSEGVYGTIPELYVRRGYRSNNIGKKLLDWTTKFAKEKGWKRLEVTTPPLPQFYKTLHFYQVNGFEITGGRKLKCDVNA